MADTPESRKRLASSIDRSGLTCALTILPGLHAETPSEMEINALLDAQGVLLAMIDRDAITGLIRDARNDPDSEHHAIVARGTPPTHGEHAEFTLLPELADRLLEIASRRDHPEEKSPPEAAGHPHNPDSNDPDSVVDFRAQSAFVIVRAGDTLGTVSPGTPGADGVDVRGVAIPAKGGRSLGLESDYSTKEHNGTLVATVDGVLIHSLGRIRVDTTLTIKGDVDFHTGNIDFPGSVVVSGGVKDQFHLRATGEVHVGQLVDAADIHCDADLTLARGMAGRDTGSLRVGGDLHAGYLDSVNGTIMGDCTVINEIKECILDVRGKIESPGCALYGGCVTASQRIEVGTLGSAGGIRTRVAVGALPELTALLDRFGSLLGSLKDQHSRGESELRALRDSIRRLTSSQAERLTELQFEQIRADELSLKLAEAAQELLDTIRRPAPPVLSVRRTLHRGVEFQLRHVELIVKETTPGPLRIDLDPQGRPRCFMGDSATPTPIGQIASRAKGKQFDPVAALSDYAKRAAAAAAIADTPGAQSA